MKTITAEVLFAVQNTLGEGPLWHPEGEGLYWVDIESGDLYNCDRELKEVIKVHFDTTLGAFCFNKGGGLILATGQGFLQWDGKQSQPSSIWNPLPPRPAVRLNDGKVDPAGRFWAGSIDTERVEGELYRLDPDGSQHVMLHQIGISNGLDWSPNQQTLYYTDSYRYTIYAFDYNDETGGIQNQRTFIQLPKTPSEIVPDGLCVDAEGCLWSAQWNGWQIVRYDPQGVPILTVKVPAQRVTSCCFGGERLDQLLITTARSGLSAEELTAQPHAGDVFIVQTETTGQITNFFG